MGGLRHATRLFTFTLFCIILHLPYPVNSKLTEHYFKIGTNEQERTFWGYVIKPTERFHEEELQKFRDAAVQYAAPPRWLGVQKVGGLTPFIHWAGARLPGQGDGPPLDLRAFFEFENDHEKIKRTENGLIEGESPLERNASRDVANSSAGINNKRDTDVVLIKLKTIQKDRLMISQAPGVSLEDMPGYEFIYEDAGEGVLAYVIDTGCNPSDESFLHHKYQLLDIDSTSWIYSGPLPSDEKSDDDFPNALGKGNIPEYLADGNLWGYHGTATASKLVGWGYGHAPSVDLHIVKVHTGRNYLFPEWAFLDPLLKIYDNIIAKLEDDVNRDIKGAVISASISILLTSETRKGSSWNTLCIDMLLELLQKFEIIDPKVYFITPTGNKDTGEPIITEPVASILEAKVKNERSFAQCIVVGGVELDGSTIYQDHPYVDFYAPANHIPLPLPPLDPNPEYADIFASRLIPGTGTSLAAPTVAGLLASLIGIGIKDPVSQLKKWAYPRIEGGHDVVWNGVTKEMWGSTSWDGIETSDTGIPVDVRGGGGGDGKGRKRPPSSESSGSGKDLDMEAALKKGLHRKLPQKLLKYPVP
ncbi:hypothetical protein TWF730_000526 [Orbilia blumenaviensis]|uniref:Peptidase S8/S53 domain-containing protein n=1 Tax=Orbilia blumenaviensis TaxID=1796055 RepID=A0AAV9VN39_9PEZI